MKWYKTDGKIVNVSKVKNKKYVYIKFLTEYNEYDHIYIRPEILNDLTKEHGDLIGKYLYYEGTGYGIQNIKIHD